MSNESPKINDDINIIESISYPDDTDPNNIKWVKLPIVDKNVNLPLKLSANSGLVSNYILDIEFNNRYLLESNTLDITPDTDTPTGKHIELKQQTSPLSPITISNKGQFDINVAGPGLYKDPTKGLCVDFSSVQDQFLGVFKNLSDFPPINTVHVKNYGYLYKTDGLHLIVVGLVSGNPTYQDYGLLSDSQNIIERSKNKIVVSGNQTGKLWGFFAIYTNNLFNCLSVTNGVFDSAKNITTFEPSYPTNSGYIDKLFIGLSQQSVNINDNIDYNQIYDVNDASDQVKIIGVQPNYIIVKGNYSGDVDNRLYVYTDDANNSGTSTIYQESVKTGVYNEQYNWTTFEVNPALYYNKREVGHVLTFKRPSGVVSFPEYMLFFTRAISDFAVLGVNKTLKQLHVKSNKVGELWCYTDDNKGDTSIVKFIDPGTYNSVQDFTVYTFKNGEDLGLSSVGIGLVSRNVNLNETFDRKYLQWYNVISQQQDVVVGHLSSDIVHNIYTLGNSSNITSNNNTKYIAFAAKNDDLKVKSIDNGTFINESQKTVYTLSRNNLDKNSADIIGLAIPPLNVGDEVTEHWLNIVYFTFVDISLPDLNPIHEDKFLRLKKNAQDEMYLEWDVTPTGIEEIPTASGEYVRVRSDDGSVGWALEDVDIGVKTIIAGNNIDINPATGVGDVTISSQAKQTRNADNSLVWTNSATTDLLKVNISSDNDNDLSLVNDGLFVQKNEPDNETIELDSNDLLSVKLSNKTNNALKVDEGLYLEDPTDNDAYARINGQWCNLYTGDTSKPSILKFGRGVFAATSNVNGKQQITIDANISQQNGNIITLVPDGLYAQASGGAQGGIPEPQGALKYVRKNGVWVSLTDSIQQGANITIDEEVDGSITINGPNTSYRSPDNSLSFDVTDVNDKTAVLTDPLTNSAVEKKTDGTLDVKIDGCTIIKNDRNGVLSAVFDGETDTQPTDITSPDGSIIVGGSDYDRTVTLTPPNNTSSVSKTNGKLDVKVDMETIKKNNDGSLYAVPTGTPTTSGVTKIKAGTNVTISPSSGTGEVTINSTASGGGGATYYAGNGINIDSTNKISVKTTDLLNFDSKGNLNINSDTTLANNSGALGINSSYIPKPSSETNGYVLTADASNSYSPKYVLKKQSSPGNYCPTNYEHVEWNRGPPIDNDWQVSHAMCLIRYYVVGSTQSFVAVLNSAWKSNNRNTVNTDWTWMGNFSANFRPQNNGQEWNLHDNWSNKDNITTERVDPEGNCWSKAYIEDPHYHYLGSHLFNNQNYSRAWLNNNATRSSMDLLLDEYANTNMYQVPDKEEHTVYDENGDVIRVQWNKSLHQWVNKGYIDPDRSTDLFNRLLDRIRELEEKLDK